MHKKFNNKERYKEGKHYICLSGNELKEFKGNSLNLGIANNINTLYLWTERGAFLHAKSLNTE
ncbi:MAG: ORF6N domain-containing protein [Erysipelotrichaceae bacterium]|nr:ORF6N domain-containing protein [Erysipelotrichaceae bacterium]